MRLHSPVLPGWWHQTQVADIMLGRAFYALFMEMGTGKTKVIIDDFCELWLQGKVDTVVIFAKKGTYMNWLLNELPTHMPQSVWDAAVVRVWRAGGGNVGQQRELMELMQRGPWLRILIINTESYSSGDKARKFVEKMIEGGRVYLTLDECTDIKNPESKKTKNLLDLAHRPEILYRRIMSGLPNPKSPTDLYSQGDFLSPGLLGESWYAFRARYCLLKDLPMGPVNPKTGQRRKVTKITGYKNTDDLAERIKPWSFRVLKKDCLDIPEKVYRRHPVEMTHEQERLYSEMKSFALAELSGGGVVSSVNAITQMLRLQQMLCGHVKNDDGDLVEVPTNRIDALADVLEDLDSGRKAIIWTKYRHDVDQIVRMLGERFPEDRIAQFHGGNERTRHLDSQAFQNDPSTRWMVATYAGGHGNTWTAATLVVYYSNDFDLEKRMQSEDRAHRGGQRNVVTYVDLYVPGTIDERVVEALRNKIDLSTAVLGDGYKKWLV